MHVVSSGNNISAETDVPCHYMFINFKSSLTCDYRNQLLLQIEVVDGTEHVRGRASQRCTNVPRSLDVMCMYICQKSSLWILQIHLSVKLYLRHALIFKIPFIGGREMAQKLRVYTALSQDSCSVSSFHMVPHKDPWLEFQGNWHYLLVSAGTSMYVLHRYARRPSTQIHSKKYSQKLKIYSFINCVYAGPTYVQRTTYMDGCSLLQILEIILGFSDLVSLPTEPSHYLVTVSF